MRTVWFFAISGLATLWAQSAVAQDDVHWFGFGDEDHAALIYGVPNTGFALLSFRCNPSEQILRFSHEYEPADATDGMAVTMTLATETVELPIETTGVRLDMDDLFILEAEIEADARLSDLLLSDGPLTVQIGNDVQTFTLEGAYAPAKDLLKACTPS